MQIMTVACFDCLVLEVTNFPRLQCPYWEKNINTITWVVVDNVRLLVGLTIVSAHYMVEMLIKIQDFCLASANIVH